MTASGWSTPWVRAENFFAVITERYHKPREASGLWRDSVRLTEIGWSGLSRLGVQQRKSEAPNDLGEGGPRTIGPSYPVMGPWIPLQ